MAKNKGSNNSNARNEANSSQSDMTVNSTDKMNNKKDAGAKNKGSNAQNAR